MSYSSFECKCPTLHAITIHTSIELAAWPDDVSADILSSSRLTDILSTCINGLLPPGYNILRADRKNGRQGGGVAVIYEKTLKNINQ